jgi:site-specific DNA-methyltransferase (adenine-specific)
VSAVRVEHGDSRAVLKTLADCSIDSVVCDPPYALVSIGKRFGGENAKLPTTANNGAYAYNRHAKGFMGKQWDNGSTAFDPDFWREVWRVLKPGAHGVAFGGTRS